MGLLWTVAFREVKSLHEEIIRARGINVVLRLFAVYERRLRVFLVCSIRITIKFSGN